MAKKLPPCDCLNYCGDDPWITKGKARPCAHKIKRDAEDAQHEELQAMIAAKHEEMRAYLAKITKDAPWSVVRCACGELDCTDHLLSFVRTDDHGRVRDYEAYFIVAAREYFELLERSAK